MVVRVSEIPDQGLRVDSPHVVGPVFTEAGWSLDTVALLVERRDQRVDISGRFEATARLACGRCLEPVAAHVAPTVEIRLVPLPDGRPGEAELGREDLEVDFYRGDELDLGALLRSETALALPMKPLCRPDCRGLCPVCGTSRNLAACSCETRGTDPRLAPLLAWKRRS
jgi:uncharacterized protein